MTTSQQTLAECAQDLEDEVVVLKLNDKPVAAIVPLEALDDETWRLSISPDFLAIVERSRAEYLAGKKFTLEEMKREIATM